MIDKRGRSWRGDLYWRGGTKEGRVKVERRESCELRRRGVEKTKDKRVEKWKGRLV